MTRRPCVRCRIASFQQVRDGRVIENRGFIDSFDVAEQVLGRELRELDVLSAGLAGRAASR